MDDDYLWDLGRFEHKANRLPRKNFLGENVFYDNWLKLLKSKDDMSEPANRRFADILGCYGHQLDERAATVAATFIAWLGTNLGYAYRYESQQLAKQIPHLPDVYLMSWAKFNLRRTGSSYSRRQLESLLMEDDSTYVMPSVKDYEVVEHLVTWLGTEEGQEFLTTCEAEIARRQKNEEFRNYLADTLKLPEHAVNRVLAMAATYVPDTPKSPA